HGEKAVDTLIRESARLVEMAEMDEAARPEPGLLLELCTRELRRRPARRTVVPRALRELPEAALDRVAVLLDEVERLAIPRDDECEVRFLDHAVDARRPVPKAHVVLADPHPPVPVDLARREPLDHCSRRWG